MAITGSIQQKNGRKTQTKMDTDRVQRQRQQKESREVFGTADQQVFRERA